MTRPFFFLAVFLDLGISAQASAQPSDQAATRANQLKAGIETTSAIDPNTATLAEALDDWIVLLEANDVETAQKRWAKDSTATKTMKQWWANLGDCHKQYDYRKWLDRAKQIGDAAQFKVGGHSFGHVHVDWEKTGKGWRIAKVWICR